MERNETQSNPYNNQEYMSGPLADDPRWAGMKGLLELEDREQIVFNYERYNVPMNHLLRISFHGDEIKVRVDLENKAIRIDGKIVYRLGDGEKRIEMKGKIFSICYHGVSKSFWLDDQRYEVRVNAPPRIFLIDGLPTTFKIDERNFLHVDNMETCVYGGPPNEIDIHGNKRQISFQTPSRVADYVKDCQLNLDGHIPCIIKYGVCYGIHFGGGTCTVFINNERHDIPVYKTVDLEIDSRMMRVALGGPYHEIIINGKWFNVKFNNALPTTIYLGEQRLEVGICGEQLPLNFIGPYPTDYNDNDLLAKNQLEVGICGEQLPLNFIGPYPTDYNDNDLLAKNPSNSILDHQPQPQTSLSHLLTNPLSSSSSSPMSSWPKRQHSPTRPTLPLTSPSTSHPAPQQRLQEPNKDHCGCDLKIITLNVRGLKQKIEQVKQLIEQHKPHFLFLQETQIWTDEVRIQVEEKMRSVCDSFYWKYYDRKCYLRGRGVVILQPCSLHWRVVNPELHEEEDEDGRIISLFITNNNNDKLHITNIHAAAQNSEKAKFYKNLLTDLIPIKQQGQRLIVGGDFNMIKDDHLDMLDRTATPYQYPSTRMRYNRTPLHAKKMMDKLLEKLHVRDSFRSKYPDKKRFTFKYTRTRPIIREYHSRLDKIIGDSSLEVVNVKHLNTWDFTDHKAVSVTYRLYNKKRT